LKSATQTYPISFKIRQFPRFVGLATNLLLTTVVANFAVKIDVFGN